MKKELEQYLLHLADTTLVLAQRNGEWCSHGPILEQDIAITNITLDLIGQARLFYQYAASIIGNTTEDELAYNRDEKAFSNLLLVEIENGDWSQTILRQYLFSQYQLLLFTELKNHEEKELAAIAEKSIKETTYHVRWSKDWVLRLGDGTEESKTRLTNALKSIWPYTDEMFKPASYEKFTNINWNKLQQDWKSKCMETFSESTLLTDASISSLLQDNTIQMFTGGKQGNHTTALAPLLAELQSVQRAYPNSSW